MAEGKGAGHIVGHGCYERWVEDGDCQRYLICIQRYLCKVCGRTFSCPPSFVVPYKRFDARVLSRVLHGRFVEDRSWRGLWEKMLCGSVSSMRRWVRSFCARSEALRSVSERFGGADMGSEAKDVARCLFGWSARVFGVDLESMVECAAMGLMWVFPQVGMFMSLC